MREIEETDVGRPAPTATMEKILLISKAPPAPTWLFSLAAAAGAVALAVLFRVQHPTAPALIFSSAAAGAVLRRTVARFNTNIFLPTFRPAVLARVVGAP